jgi:hypothetical protein
MTNLFKYLYDKRTYITYNAATPLWARVKKEYGAFTMGGKSKVIEAVLGFTGGVGSGSLPDTNVFNEQNATITRKKIYSRIIMDREAMLASKGESAAFEAVTKRQVKKGVESFVRNLSRTLFAAENGMLGQGDASTTVTGAGTTADPWLVIISAATWNEGFWEEKDYVNCASETTPLEVMQVVPATRQIKLRGTSAEMTLRSITTPAATSAKFYMQGSKDNDPESLIRVLKLTSGSSYCGIDIGRRWQAFQKDADGVPLSADLMNEVALGIEKQSGEAPDLIVTSYTQFRKLKNVLEDLKYYPVTPRDELAKKAKIGWQGVEYMSTNGGIPIVVDRMCPADTMLFLNTNYITWYGIEPAKWVDEDGSVLFRSSTADSFESRMALYGELFVEPAHQGILYDLAT